jgi:putative phage-type endonuclease
MSTNTQSDTAPRGALIDDRAAWLEARRKVVAATDASAIVGENPWASPYTVWRDKMGLSEEKPDTPSMQRGRDAEPWIAMLFNRDHNVNNLPMVRGDFVVHPQIPYFGATPDYYLGDDALIECKYAGPNAARAFGEEWSDDVPTHYLIQVQWQMFVTGRKVAYLVVDAPTISPTIKVYEIPRNQALIDTISGICKKFWMEHVVTETPPPIGGTKGDDDVLRNMKTPSDDSVSVRAPEALEVQIELLKTLTDSKKDIEKRKEAAENAIKLYMLEQGAMTLMSNSGPFKLSERSRTSIGVFEVQKLLREQKLDGALADPFIKTSTFTVLMTPFKSKG